jgi:hypothetical protein
MSNRYGSMDMANVKSQIFSCFINWQILIQIEYVEQDKTIGDVTLKAPFWIVEANKVRITLSI